MNNVSLEVLVVRALKTFVQAFLAALGASTITSVSVPAIKAIVIAAIAAGISAVMNLFLQPKEAK